jgi:two-component system, LytTR family, sensor kinase
LKKDFNFNFDFNSNNQTKILLHILVWLMFFSIPLFNFVFSNHTINYTFFIVISLCVCVFYVNFSLLVPKYLIQKKWFWFFFFLLMLFFTHCSIFLQIEPFVPGSVNIDKMSKEIRDQINTNSFLKIFPGILLFVLMISVSSFLKIYEVWNENFKRQKEIESENRTTELNFLKSQLNPHFFFNSLNTIYSLSISKSEKTSEAILNLSELMRYMLGDKKDNSISRKVRLIDELEYIKNYISLQKLRITPNNKIEFTIEGKTENVQVFPLMFISFIENAFKYGVNPTDETTIKIAFKTEKNFLYFEVKNNIHFQKNSYDSFGLGNENSIKRLNLYYPTNKLSITKDNQYVVNLKIDLNEN